MPIGCVLCISGSVSSLIRPHMFSHARGSVSRHLTVVSSAWQDGCQVDRNSLCRSEPVHQTLGEHCQCPMMWSRPYRNSVAWFPKDTSRYHKARWRTLSLSAVRSQGGVPVVAQLFQCRDIPSRDHKSLTCRPLPCWWYRGVVTFSHGVWRSTSRFVSAPCCRHVGWLSHGYVAVRSEGHSLSDQSPIVPPNRRHWRRLWFCWTLSSDDPTRGAVALASKSCLLALTLDHFIPRPTLKDLSMLKLL